MMLTRRALRRRNGPNLKEVLAAEGLDEARSAVFTPATPRTMLSAMSSTIKLKAPRPLPANFVSVTEAIDVGNWVL